MINNKKVYIVLGLPRSGTSLVSGILSNLGIPMTYKNEIRDDKYNSRGYFENLVIVNINVVKTQIRTFLSMLEKIDAIKNHEDNTIISDSISYDIPIYKMFENYDIWGVKDSRFCYPNILNEFINTISEYTDKQNIKIILTYRNFFEIAESLCNIIMEIEHIDMDMNSVLHKLMHMFTMALRELDNIGIPFKIASYHDLLEQPSLSVLRIANFCEVPITLDSVNFVDKSLRHFEDKL